MADVRPIEITGPPFECERSCERILRKGMTGYITADAHLICASCALTELQGGNDGDMLG
jgi:hypothetical protein